MAIDVKTQEQLSEIIKKSMSPFAAQLEAANKKIDLLLAENLRLREEKEILERTGKEQAAIKIEEFRNKPLFEQFMASKGLRKTTTRNQMLGDINTFLRFIKPKHILDVTKEDVTAFYLDELNNKKNSDITVDKKRIELGQFYDYIIKEQTRGDYPRIIRENPFKEAEKIKAVYIPKKGLDETDAIKFIKTALTTYNKYRIYGFIAEMLLGTGMRVSELLNVTKGDIDTEKRLIHLTKTKNGRPRDVPYPSILQSKIRLAIVRLNDEDKIFEPSYVLVDRNFNRIGNLAGIDIKDAKTNKPLKVAPHMLRHTFATTLINREVPLELISKVMGHSGESITEKSYYDKVNLDKIKGYLDKYTILNKLEII